MIASSRMSLATQTAAICVRVRHAYVTMQVTFLTLKSALIYRRGLRQRVASLTLDCNGVFAIKAYDLFEMASSLENIGQWSEMQNVPVLSSFYSCGFCKMQSSRP